MSESNNNNRVLDENVVLFPASKNFPLESKKKIESVDLHDDPLEALLREFDDVADLDFDDDLEFELEEIAREQMNHHLRNTDLRTLAQLDKDELTETIEKQMKVLSETQARISYLLREIESYMPGRK